MYTYTHTHTHMYVNICLSIYTYMHVYIQEGVRSLYRGLTATCIRGVPNTGIQFAVYEGLKTLLLLQ